MGESVRHINVQCTCWHREAVCLPPHSAAAGAVERPRCGRMSVPEPAEHVDSLRPEKRGLLASVPLRAYTAGTKNYINYQISRVH